MMALVGAAVMSMGPFNGAARWIWDGGAEKPVDAYRLFRREFSLRKRPDKALLRITADAEYRLYVNGEYVARGPAPNPPSHITFDEIDVAANVRAGKNVLAVIVNHPGVPTFPRVLARAGLLAQLDLPGKPLVTDANWRWRDAWWVATGEKFSPFRAFTEHLDARSEPVGWDRPGFDDSKWQKAVEIGPPGTAPWTAMDARDIPMPEHHDSLPKRVMFVNVETNEIPAKKDAAAQLAAEPRRFGYPRVTGVDALLGPTNHLCVVPAGHVIGLDFGQEVSGYPEIEAECDTDGAVIDIGFGEGLEPDGHISVRRQGNPDADRFTLRKGSQRLRIFHHRAFRYCVLIVRGGKVTLRSLKVVESGYPVQMRGAFACSDPKLTQIWEVGRRTMQICMDQGFMDCPWRERGQYVGDGLAEMPVALYAFGDTALMRRFLRQALFTQPDDGLLLPAYPSDWILFHGNRGPWRIPGYGALWVVMLDQFYRATKDDALIRELAPVTDRQFEWFRKHVGDDGMLHDVPEWNFIDWANMKPESAMTCLNIQYEMCLRAAADLDAALGRSSTRRQEADKLAASFDRAHWDAERGLYRDAAGLYTQHTNALALFALVPAGDARAARIIAQLEAPDLLKPESPYFEGFVLRALCKHGRQDLALAKIQAKWWPMIEGGATTFWESYAAQWSLCHAWSCTPTALLSEELLGVTYDATTKRVRVAPHPLSVTWAQGVAPLACGDVNVRWEQRGKEFVLRMAVPPGTVVDADVPASEGSTILLGGAEAPWERKNGRARGTLGGGDGSFEVTVRSR